MPVYDIAAIGFQIRRAVDIGQGLLHAHAGQHRSFAVPPGLPGHSVHLRPHFGSERTHQQVGAGLSLQAGRTVGTRAEHDGPVLYQPGDLRQQFRPHGFEFGKHQQSVLRSVRQSQQPVAHRRPVAQHLPVDIVELITGR